MKTIITYIRKHSWVGYMFGIIVFCGFGLGMTLLTETKVSEAIEIGKIDIHHVIDGHNMVEASELRSKIETEFEMNLEQTSISELDLIGIESLVEADPFVKDAEVYIDAKNKLNINVWQRDPIMRVIDQDGYSYYVDQFKHRVPFSKIYTARVPVVTGNVSPYPKEDSQTWDETQEGIYEIINICAKDKILSALISQIDVNSKNEIMLYPVIGDEEIVFGNVDRIADKLENLKIFYQKGLRQEGWKKYKQIDLRYEDLVYGKRNKLNSDTNKNIDKS